ncbi:hypothetical protein MNBD_GAMMA16-1632 [hydrothermal vent metagenome]|uniref:ER-bound oxygenase mpaB/mpaB'/Rubber oxygenase catalytic domain-containing protein n=1 Tax=hydrothermal vent metagenome TaxID=652676 RepID=A0A3B0ZAD7_9ZZZZ
MDLSADRSNVLGCLPGKEEEIPANVSEYFDELRQTGDELADKLVKETLFPHDQFQNLGRQGYNHLLDIADVLAESPALALNSHTTIAQELSEYPKGLQNYYDPIKAPDWVDEEKLALTSKLWQQDMLAIISVLYGVSLPTCYLMKNGIPALYDSAKLADKKYIYQRIYETGLMLDAVLAPDGIQVIRDLDHSSDEHLLDSLNKNDPKGKWQCQGNILSRTDDARVEPESLNLDQHVQHATEENNGQAARYLWGKGYVAAKKIRFLHASMRFMLMNPAAMAKTRRPGKPKEANFSEAIQYINEPYNTQVLGVPVNQEDQAYTLLTFAYCIPKGLEKLGRFWSKEESEAFLHTWKVVGYTMGIQENLMVDTLADAEKLFEFIQRRQVGESDQAKQLTKTVVYFFQDYLPSNFGLSKGIATRLITDQLGEVHAKMILPQEYIDEANRPIVALVFTLAMKVLWLYYRARRILFKIPYMARFFKGVFYGTGMDLVKSWRDAYSRKPFYIPLTVNTWKREKGVNPAFLKKLRAWRHDLFNTMAVGLSCVIFSGVFFLFFLIFSLFDASGAAKFTGWASFLLVLLGLFILHYKVGQVSEQRPQPEQMQKRAAQPESTAKEA